MPTTARHRALVLSAVAALAAAGLMAGAGPAAAVPIAEGQAISGLDLNLTGGGPDCNSPDAADKSTNVVFSTATGAKTVANTTSATVTDSTNLPDVTTMTARSATTSKVTAAGGSLSTIDITTSLRAKIDAAQGFNTSCDVSADAIGGAQALFTIAEPGWLSITSSKSQGGIHIFGVGSMTGEALQTYSIRIKSSDTYRFFLPTAGDYQFISQVIASVATPSDPFEATDEESTVSMHGKFLPAGAASGPATGPGARYLKLGAERSCSANTLSSTFTSKARAVAKAQVYANGKLVATVRNPKPGKVVKIANLADASPLAVRAVLTLKAGGKAGVARSYVACS